MLIGIDTEQPSFDTIGRRTYRYVMCETLWSVIMTSMHRECSSSHPIFEPIWTWTDDSSRLKMYKKKLKDWGIRKNIKADEAFEMAAGHSNKSIDFWPESRSSDYDLRIARHLKRCKHGKSIREQSCTSCRTHRDATLASLGTTPTYSSSALANVEMGLHSARIYFETASPAKLAQWTYTPANITLKNEKFMTLFNQSVESLSREAGTKQAFININRAFDMLHGLMKEDHPAVYHMMVNSMALCKSYPSSELCFKVCRMFAKYCQQLSLVVLGTAHPINPCFTADVGMVEFGEVGDFVLFLRGSTDMCIKYGAVYKPGMEASRCRIVSIER